MAINHNEVFIKKNYDTLISIVEKVYKVDSDAKRTNKPPLLQLLLTYSERYALCPASTTKDYFAAFPGGLCYHTLSVAKWAIKLANLLAPNQYSEETLLKVAILSDFGKIGSETENYFIMNESQWHIQKGLYYDINPNVSFMRIAHRSLKYAIDNNISLNEEEYLAILLSDGQNDSSNESYKFRESKLALILQFAKQWAQKADKDIQINWLP